MCNKLKPETLHSNWFWHRTRRKMNIRCARVRLWSFIFLSKVLGKSLSHCYYSGSSVDFMKRTGRLQFQNIRIFLNMHTVDTVYAAKPHFYGIV